MLIIVDALAAGEGGGKWFTRSLVEEMAIQNRDWKFVLYYSDKSFMENSSRKIGNIIWNHVPNASMYSHRLFFQQVGLRKEVKRMKANLIFSPLNIGMFLPPVPQVTVQRNAHHLVAAPIEINGLNKLKRYFQKYMSLLSIKSSKENIFVSWYMYNLAARYLRADADHWHVIHNAVNTKRFSSKVECLIKDKYILYVGIVRSHKNIDLILKAFALLVSRNQVEEKLILVGNFNEHSCSGALNRLSDSLLALAAVEKIDDRVVFWGAAEGDNLTAMYRYAEVCVVPSLLESFGVIPAEALYCGTPCIASDIPVFHEIYEDAVLYCDPNSPKDLADKILLLLNNRDLAKQLVEKAKPILNRHQLSVVAKQYSKVLQKAYDGIVACKG